LANTQPLAGSHVSSVHPLPSVHCSELPDRQLPPPHVSPVVHALPSLHGAALFVNTQPLAGLHVSSVHPFPSVHCSGLPAWQLPPAHVSPVVHALPSLHGAALSVNTQPLEGLHVSFVQTLSSVHASGVPAWQLPPAHVSPVVHALPSSQEPTTS